MKKFARTICVLMLAAVLGISCFSFVACKPPQDDEHPNEKRPVVFSVGELDNVFNPFFSTSAYDSEITGNTQIAMLTTDRDGKVYCGVDEPTVAANYSQTIFYRENSTDEEFEIYENGRAPELPKDVAPDSIPAEDYYTRYQFLIKNNIKFSDGEPLTIKDVIFNLYTYLDPTYYGSSTIYSTAIKGLQKYRLQDENASDEQSASFNQDMLNKANNRLNRMRSMYLTDEEERLGNRGNEELLAFKDEILKDVETVRYMFWDEISSDYAASEAALNDYIEENEKEGNEDAKLGFTEVWEIFLYNEGLISVTYNSDGTIDTYDTDAEAQDARDKNGEFRKAGDKKINYAGTGSWWHDKDSLIRIVFNERMGIATRNENDETVYGKYEYDASHAITEPDKAPRPESDMYGPKTDIVVDELGKAVGSTFKASETDQSYWDRLWNSDKLIANLYEIITYWATASNARDQFVAEEKSKYFEVNGTSINTIDGITVHKLAAGSTFKGQFGNTVLTEDQYVLQIEIERVDPKAIWNFGFAVAPMHYYSDATNDTTGTYDASVDYRSFNYPGIDGYDSSKKISVGRPFGEKDYLDKVLKASKIISVPVGAGMYKVASYNTQDENYGKNDRPSFVDFSSNNVVYFIRNPYFYTTSGEGKTAEESSIKNCKIKYIRYQVISTARLLDAVLSGQVDYGDPTATIKNVEKIDANADVGKKEVDNNGYGYIGINATYVPDLAIRQAIMHAMDLQRIKTYYGSFAEIIYRPVSTVSWASPQNTKNPYYGKEEYNRQYYTYYEDDAEMDNLIESKIKSCGYQRDSDNVYFRTLDDGTKHRLEYTFTIAGATDDHPAYDTMQKAADILNRNGFKVTVKTDSNALSKLSAGTLAVWAAAWSSATDPDMYQVYHMESTATSVKSWGYPTIIENKLKPTYSAQYKIIEDLSKLIDEARSVLDTEARAKIYVQAYDMVMDLAVELPTYQRINLYAFRNKVLDETTFNPNPTPHSGPLSRLWEVSLLETAV